MSGDHIETLSASHERRIAEELDKALASYLDTLDLTALASTLDDIDANHIREQLEVQFGLDDAGQPEPLLDLLAGVFLVLASFGGAVVALAASQARHTVNPQSPEIVALQVSAGDFVRRFLADTAQSIRAAIETAIYAPGKLDQRAALLKQSIGLGARQFASLETMHDALMAYVNAPKKRIPARLDRDGKRQPVTIVRDVDTRAILASTRGHISGPQRAMLAKALKNPSLTEADANALLGRHATALRRFRARSVAGEGIHALTENAKLVGWLLAQRFGALPTDQRRYWKTAGDERVRHTHAAVPGMNPNGVLLDQPFATPFGPTMTPPLEYGCRCRVQIRAPR